MAEAEIAVPRVDWSVLASDEEENGSDALIMRSGIPGNKKHADSDESKNLLKKKRARQAAKDEERIAVRKQAREDQLAKSMQKFQREGKKARLDKIKNRDFANKLRQEQEFQSEAAESAARAAVLLTESEGFLEAENEMEKTYKVTQRDLLDQADSHTATKAVDLKLGNFAPYRLDWTRNGRYLLMGGRKGHVSMVDALRVAPRCEFQVGESVRDISFLHDQSLFAVAQKKHIFIYNDSGAEVHRLRSHVRPDRLEFLPYHWLLASVGRGGWLKYQDTSTGELVSEHRTRLGPCNVMTQNPYNAVVCLGHGNGTVTMWSPASSVPLVKMFCHNGPVGCVAVNRGGTELVTSGLDGKVSIWDVRTYKRLHSYHTPRPPLSVDISATGLLAVTCGYQVQIWKDALHTKAQSPYMRHARPGDNIGHCKFRPYEDVLGLGHSSGLETIVVPGAGVANYDAFESNPFETRKQQREGTVKKLLEKLQPEMIVLDPQQIARVNSTPLAVQIAEAEAENKANAQPKKLKNKQKGKNKIGRKLKRQHKNIVTAERELLVKKREEERVAREEAAKAKNDPEFAKDSAASKAKANNPMFQRFAKSKASNRS